MKCFDVGQNSFSPERQRAPRLFRRLPDVNGDLISLSASAPMHLSSLMGMVQNIVKRFP
jgi:hypothetical protein